MITLNHFLIRAFSSRFILIYLLLFFISGGIQAQNLKGFNVNQPQSTAYNFSSFTKVKKGNLNDWKKWNSKADYSHPEFGIQAADAPCNDCVEVISKRERDEKYFVNTKDTTLFYIQKSLGDINFKKDGRWVSLHHRIKEIAPKVYESEFLAEPAGIETDKQRTYIKTPSGKMYFNSWTLWKRTNGKEVEIGKANWSNFTIGDDGMYIKNVFEGIDAELIIFRGAIKTNFIMKKNQYGAFDDLIFRDAFAHNSNLRLKLEETPHLKEGTGTIIINDLAKINPAVIYPKGGSKAMAQSAAYIVSDNTVGVVVPFSWINRYIDQYELVIDPLVTGSNTLAQAAITGSMYNASCNFTNSCNYNLSVTQPAATTITDITFSIVYIATGICWLQDGGMRFGLAGCRSPANTNTWTCNTTLGGTCTGTNLSIFSDLQTCIPARSCASQVLPFQFLFYRSCFGASGCDSNCIGAGSPLTLTIHGRTVEIPAATTGGINLPSTTICQGGSMVVGTNGGLTGVPTYTYNWSFSPTGAPSVGTGASPNITFPTPGNQTLYLFVTDSCGNTASTSRPITVTAGSPASVTITANPSGPICTGTTVTFTAVGVNPGTAPVYQWIKNTVNVGTNSSTYTATGLNNGDVITVRLISNAPCSNSPVTSPPYVMQVSSAATLTPNAVTLPAVTGQCSATVTTTPSATNPCTGQVVTGTTTSPLTYNIQGTYTITWNYIDTAGNTASQTQQVIVDDTIAPVPVVAALPAATGQCAVTVTAPVANDNCKGSITATTTNPLTYNTQGTYSITWTYNDGNGNTSTQTQQVIVDDTIAPVPTITTLPTITRPCNATVTAPTATDNCTGAITGTTTNPLTYNTQGTYSITWTYSDGNGNTSTQIQQVIVDDTIAPVPTVATLPTITRPCNATVTAPTATDNCAGSITGTTTSPLTYNTQGTYNITWIYNDGNGNTSTQIQQVIIDDTIAPVPTVATLPTINAQCSVTVTRPTATDNCAGTITATTTSPLTYNANGNYSITWTYSDGNGNTSTQIQQVIVQDVAAPIPNVATLPTITNQCTATVTPPTATDNCAGTITATTTNPLTYNQNGTYTITWTYADPSGNTVNQTQQVIIQDNVAPVPNVATLPTITAACSATVTAIPTATDNCAGTITATTTSPLTYSQPGTYTITWTYSDVNGNTATQTQQVIIQFTSIPIPNVTTLPQINGQCSVTVSTVPTATNPCNGAVVNGTTTDPLTYTVSGTYTITWTYNDGNGNTSTQTQQVVLQDNIAPIPTLATLPTITDTCSATVTAIPTANDNCAGLISATTTNPTTYSLPGNYTIVWTFNDGNGNTVTQNQQVIIQNTTAPVPNVATLPTVNQQCSATVTTVPTATDTCGNTISATTTDPTSYNLNGSYTINWTYTDSSGNSASQTQQVNVSDTLNPVPTIASLPNLTGSCQITVTTFPTANDGCSGILTGTTSDPLSYTLNGTYTINWTFTDASGNTVTQTQQVIVQDTTPPVPNVASLPNITGQCGATVTTTPTATDACAGAITATTTNPLSYTTPGTYAITWTYDDGNGNTSTQTQQVIVADTTPPIAITRIVTLQLNAAGTATLTANQINNGSTDNCGIATIAINQTLFTCADLGTKIVVLTVTDNAGNTTSANATVTIVDSIAPIVQTQPVTIFLNSAGIATLTVAQVDNGSTDNCAIITRVLSQTQFTCANSGVNTVQFTATDASGNATTRPVIVTVLETVPPIASAVPTLSISLDANGLATITANDINAGSTDNCAIATITISQSQFNCTDIGSNTVTLTVTDTSGNIATASSIVTILPIPKPTTPFPTQDFCLSENATVADLIVDDQNVVWYASATATATIPLTTPLVAGTYYVANVLGTCIGTDRLEITVVLKDPPPPTGNSVITLCREYPVSLSQLQISGTGINWYTQAIGGVALDDDSIVQDGDVFYASQTIGGCESSQRFEIEIVFRYCDVTIYNAVSANGDAQNDHLIIEGITHFPENNIEIFNQWGNKVYQTSRYDSYGNVFEGYANYGLAVNGRTILPFGTYYYVFHFVNNEGILKEKTGYLHLTH